MARDFVADEASIVLGSWGGLHFVGMIIIFLSIISMVIFACADDKYKPSKRKSGKHGGDKSTKHSKQKNGKHGEDGGGGGYGGHHGGGLDGGDHNGGGGCGG
ncbi:hypothetical protein I3760_04G131900 [Carya illinoinensis]|nr:hypothetical protein I3760_04G131900 [Carya illinoinensis]